MKNASFVCRLQFAVHGVLLAFKSEKCFRTQTVLAVEAIAILVYFRAPPIWWALFAIGIAAVLSLELINTALESVIDRLHPGQHPAIGRAKDCAAAAVLIMSIGSLGVFLAAVHSLW
jgi:diacylglycerol kinase (ATP)